MSMKLLCNYLQHVTCVITVVVIIAKSRGHSFTEGPMTDIIPR